MSSADDPRRRIGAIDGNGTDCEAECWMMFEVFEAVLMVVVRRMEDGILKAGLLETDVPALL